MNIPTGEVHGSNDFARLPSPGLVDGLNNSETGLA